MRLSNNRMPSRILFSLRMRNYRRGPEAGGISAAAPPILDALPASTLTKTNANQIRMVSPHVTSGNIIIQQGTLSIETTPLFDASAGTITVNSGGFAGQFKVLVRELHPGGIVLNGGGGTTNSFRRRKCLLPRRADFVYGANSTIGKLPAELSSSTMLFQTAANGFSLTDMGFGTNLLVATNTYSGTHQLPLSWAQLGLTNQESIAKKSGSS